MELTENVLPTWREMEKVSSSYSSDAEEAGSDLYQLVDQGLCKSIGISNFNINRTKKLLKDVRIKPVASMWESSYRSIQY